MFRKFFLLILIIGNISCQKQFDKLAFEQQVAYEIFPALIDSLHRDIRVFPPAFPANYDKQGNYIGFDSVAAEKNMKDYKERKIKFYNDSLKLIIAISDSTNLLDENEKKKFLDYYENIELDTSNIAFRYKIKIDSLHADKKLKFKYLSEFPKGINIWSNKNDYNFFLNGATSFSRIQFDKTLSYGVMTSGYTIASLSGYGVLVYIKKINGKWVIDKIESTWIS